MDGIELRWIIQLVGTLFIAYGIYASYLCYKSTNGGPNCFACNMKAARNTSCWTCSRCEFDNVLDADGHQIDIQRANPRSYVKYCYKSHFTEPQDFTFCSYCVSNQTMVINLLKSFNGNDSELDDIKRALEKRYPPTCTTCQARVEIELSRISNKIEPSLNMFHQHSRELDNMHKEIISAERPSVMRSVRWWIDVILLVDGLGMIV